MFFQFWYGPSRDAGKRIFEVRFSVFAVKQNHTDRCSRFKHWVENFNERLYCLIISKVILDTLILYRPAVFEH